MTTNNKPLALAKGTSTLVRAKFGPGMLLQHEDLEQLNVYTRELNRLMFRSLFGCGVVCGLVVGTEEKCGKVNVTVGSGLALDCQGDPIYVPKSQSLVLDEDCDPSIKGPLWVVLCRTERCCSPRPASCSSDDDESPAVCTRERDGFEIRILANPPECMCGCPEADGKPTSDSKGGESECSPVGSSITESRATYTGSPTQKATDCRCAGSDLGCYKDHYQGNCGCGGGDCSACDCDCILLARLDKDHASEKPNWMADHCVRRFIRPVLMRDPQCKQTERTAAKPEGALRPRVPTPPSVKKTGRPVLSTPPRPR
jgi:hypothetical protein